METKTQFTASYADSYDLLHQDKPYAEEVGLVLALAQERLGHAPQSVIDLACGTGRHLALFAAHGLRVHGNDLSPGMSSRAEQRLRESGASGWSLSTAPMQSVQVRAEAEAGFDLATAYYTAMGYLVQPGELDRFLRNVWSLLKPGGCFFADLWNGARMAQEFSPRRERRAHNEALQIHRVSTVTAQPALNALSVNFSFKVAHVKSGATEHFEETHQVRYHTAVEVENLLLAHGFDAVATAPFFDEASHTESAWNFYVIGQKPFVMA